MADGARCEITLLTRKSDITRHENARERQKKIRWFHKASWRKTTESVVGKIFVF